MGLLDGKKGLILNIANDRSIAWHIANNAIKQGATCGFGYLPMEKMERRVRKSVEEMGQPDAWLHPCDVGKDEDIEAFMSAAGKQFGSITHDLFLVVAFPHWRGVNQPFGAILCFNRNG